MMKLHASGEDYLEAMLILQRQMEESAVRSIDLARHMEFSKSSISHAVGFLRGGSFLVMDKDGSLHLTYKGREVAENTEPPTLADYIQGILSRKAQTGKSGYSQSLYNLKDAANMLSFLQASNIMDMTGLDEKFKTKSFFSLEKPKEELEGWSDCIVNVAERNYIDGYLKGGWRKSIVTGIFA